MDDCDSNTQVFPISACCCIPFQPCLAHGSKYKVVFDSEIYHVVMTISIPTVRSAGYLRENIRKRAGVLSINSRGEGGPGKTTRILLANLSLLHVSIISSTITIIIIIIIIITTKQLTDESGFPRLLSPRVEGDISDNLFADSLKLRKENNALNLRMVCN